VDQLATLAYHLLAPKNRRLSKRARRLLHDLFETLVTDSYARDDGLAQGSDDSGGDEADDSSPGEGAGQEETLPSNETVYPDSSHPLEVGTGSESRSRKRQRSSWNYSAPVPPVSLRETPVIPPALPEGIAPAFANRPQRRTPHLEARSNIKLRSLRHRSETIPHDSEADFSVDYTSAQLDAFLESEECNLASFPPSFHVDSE
jgi:hypothetical protein